MPEYMGIMWLKMVTNKTMMGCSSCAQACHASFEPDSGKSYLHEQEGAWASLQIIDRRNLLLSFLQTSKTRVANHQEEVTVLVTFTESSSS